MKEFEILGKIYEIKTIASGRGVEGDPMSVFVICINNVDNPASLILGKVYRMLPDDEA